METTRFWILVAALATAPREMREHTAMVAGAELDKLLSEAYADGRSDQLEEMQEFQKWDEKEKQ